MDISRLWELATPYLEKNDFGVSHTQRVFAIAKQDFPVSAQFQELTYASIILHDIGGCTIKDQYEKGPVIASTLLKQLECSENFIKEVCDIISSHHEHPDSPSEAFRALYDSDKLVMLSPQEYPHYNAKEGFDWDRIVSLIYSSKGKEMAKQALSQRKKEAERVR